RRSFPRAAPDRPVPAQRSWSWSASPDVLFERLDGRGHVAAAKNLHELAVLLVNLHEVVAVVRRGVAEMLANAGHDRLPDRQERRHAGAGQDPAVEGEILLDDRRDLLALAGALQMVQDGFPRQDIAFVDLVKKVLQRERFDDAADGDDQLA